MNITKTKLALIAATSIVANFSYEYMHFGNYERAAYTTTSQLSVIIVIVISCWFDNGK